jgi:hypothetical protein
MAIPPDELYLYDALFAGNAPMRMLRREIFQEAFNLPWSHDLADDALESLIDGLIARGLVTRNDRGIVGLTPAGGEVWERERRPPWDRFCYDSAEEIDGGWRLDVFASTEALAREFVTTAMAIDLYRLRDAGASITTRIEPDHDLIPWKRATYHVVSSRYDEHDGPIDWARYEKDRTWWRSISELPGIALGSDPAPSG